MHQPVIDWTPLALFIFSYIASAFTSFGADLADKRSITLKEMGGNAILFGGLGAGLSAFVYEYLGKKLTIALASGALVGGRVISKRSISKIILRMFGGGEK